MVTQTKEQTLVHKPLPQNPDIWVSVPNYKEPILPVSNGFGWYGLQAYDFEGDKVMCHECGKFYILLGAHVVKTHKLTLSQYKHKYALFIKNKLASPSFRTKQSELLSQNYKMKEHTVHKEMVDIKSRMAELRALKRNFPKGYHRPLEYQNQYDTCNAQLLRSLEAASQIYGDTITIAQAELYRSGLSLRLRDRFGSFNKAKQLLKLTIRTQKDWSEKKYSKLLILEHMILFYKEHGYYPKLRDFRKGIMLCGRTTVQNYFGKYSLARQEAMKLKDEQDKRNNIDINAITNRIELENAGKSRR